MIYAFLGWCVEVMFHAVVKGGFINRGFEIGPLCPIYGFGALSVILILEPFKQHGILFFFLSVVFTTLIEFVAGFLLERFFHEKWWDYSNEPYNIKGYICPRFSIMWGFACVIVVYVINPPLIGMVRLIPVKLGIGILIVLYAVFAADSVVTLINVMNIRSSLRAITEIEGSLEKLSYSIGSNLSDRTLEIIDKTEQLKGTLEEKRTVLKESVDQAQWEHEMNKIKKDSKKKLEEERRHREYEELMEKLLAHKKNVTKRSRRIRLAFPNIVKGRYEHIFKD